MHTTPSPFHCIPDLFKTQEMCNKAVKDDFFPLQFVPDWFIRRDWVDMWHDDYYDDDGGHWDDDDEDKFFEWCDGYKKQKDLTHCLAPIKVLGLVYIRKRKK